MEATRILYIDEEREQILLNVDALERYFGKEYEIEGIEPLRTIPEMVALIQTKQDLATLLIDERLKENGTATYLGIELAQVVRELYPQLPIFILTSFTGDKLGESEGVVENVLDKADLNADGHVIFQRVSRHLQRYNALISGNSGRLSELIKYSLERDLDQDEVNELEALQVVRMAPTSMSELAQNNEMGRKIEELEKAIESAKGLLNSSSGNNKNV